jgi:hypothetical protein
MNDKLLIAVPSLGRAYDIEKHAGFWLKQLERYEYKLFCEPREKIYYSQTMPMSNIVFTENNCGLKGQIGHIRRYAEEKGFKYVMKCDDDMWFLKKKTSKKRSAETIEDALDEIVSEMELDKSIGGVTITKAAGYMRNPNNELWLYKKNKPFYSNSISRTELFKVPDCADIFVDLSLALECVTKGFSTKTYGRIYESCITFKNKGGFQSTNRDELSRKVYPLLREVYPEIRERPDTKNPCFDIDVSYYF